MQPTSSTASGAFMEEGAAAVLENLATPTSQVSCRGCTPQSGGL